MCDLQGCTGRLGTLSSKPFVTLDTTPLLRMHKCHADLFDVRVVRHRRFICMVYPLKGGVCAQHAHNVRTAHTLHILQRETGEL